MDQFFNTFLSSLKSTKDCDQALKMTGIVDTPEKKQAVEALKLTLKAKPKVWLHKRELTASGGLKMPAAVYLDSDGGTAAIDHLISMLEEYKTAPDASKFVRKADR
jgi:hypothetical protein